jgi:ABC-type Fe3+ transport system permease subunit
MPQRPQRGSKFLGTLLALITLTCIAWPAIGIAWLIIHGIAAGIAPKPADPQGPGGVAIEMLPPLSLVPNLPLLIQTLAWAIGIALVATLFAWPGAWAIRRRGWGIVGLICVPLMLPNYLAYAAYNIIRSPGWFLGNWLETLAKQGYTNAPMYAGRVIALVGLSLWAWPIAAIILGASVKRLDPSVLDALRLEPMGRLRRALVTLRLCRAGIIGAVGAVTLVMLGSAVPFQLSMVSHYAIKVWLDLTLAPGSWRVWAAAWPLVLIAFIAGWLIATRIIHSIRTQEDSDTSTPTPFLRPRVSLSRCFAVSLWFASVIIPLALFAVSLSVVNTDHGIALALDQWKAIPRFFKVAGDSITGSLWVCAAVGGISLIITTAVWQSLSCVARQSLAGSRPTLILFTTRAFLIAGLLPGVLTGAAVSAAANMTDATRDLADSPWILVIGHTARFAFVPALIGCWLAAIEPRQERELRALDGALNFTGWAMASLPIQAGALIAAALATAALSLHEIEAAVVLQPPGTPSLAQVMLAYLHQLRMGDLSAAGVVLVGGGLIVAIIAALGVRWTARQGATTILMVVPENR